MTGMDLQPTTPTPWLTAMTHPRRELLAVEHLERQGFRTYCPMALKRIRHARKSCEARRPLFPSYIFIEHNTQAPWRPIMSTVGVRNLVQAAGRPALLEGTFITALRDREISGVISARSEDFACGQRVSVDSGPLTGLIGEIVQLKERDRVVLLLDMLGQKTRVQIAADEIRATMAT